MNFETVNGFAPKGTLDFVWLGEYLNGQIICEFDPLTKRKNDFYQINKAMLSKFGLIGQGMKLYFDTDTGMFNLNGQKIYFSYKEKDREYHLTGYSNGQRYNDIITYKDAYTDADIINPKQNFTSHIHQYNFGFKTRIKFDDVEIGLQIIFSLPYDSPAYMQIKVVSNADLNGELYIKKVGRMTEAIQAPLKQGYAGVLEWIVN